MSTHNPTPRMRPHPGLCRHCHASPANRPRRLCWACYYRPGVRELYPMLKNGYGPQDRHGRQPLPEPTRALPGTPAKVAVLAARAGRREALFHPADAPLDAAYLPQLVKSEKTINCKTRGGKYQRRSPARVRRLLL